MTDQIETLMIPAPILAAHGSAPASGIFIDGAGRFGIAAGPHRLAIRLDGALAAGLANALAIVADRLAAREAAAAAAAGDRLGELVSEARH